jgi:hypothetical protein
MWSRTERSHHRTWGQGATALASRHDVGADKGACPRLHAGEHKVDALMQTV